MLRRVKWGNVLCAVMWVMMFCFFAWFCASYFDIVTHNLSEHPTYKTWNLFMLTMTVQ